MPRPTNSASIDAMLDTQSDPHRRRILPAVSDHNPRYEDEFTPDEVATDGMDDTDLESIKTQLHHTHLPKLADKGSIE